MAQKLEVEENLVYQTMVQNNITKLCHVKFIFRISIVLCKQIGYCLEVLVLIASTKLMLTILNKREREMIE